MLHIPDRDGVFLSDIGSGLHLTGIEMCTTDMCMWVWSCTQALRSGADGVCVGVWTSVDRWV